MSLRLSGTDPFLRASIGAFSGYNFRLNNPISGATLLKRGAASAWHGVHVVDDGGTGNYSYLYEFNPGNQLAGDAGGTGPFTSTATFNDTTNWMIVGFTWDGLATAGHEIWRWKIGSGAWANEAETNPQGVSAVAGSGYRHIIGNEAALGDDANFDWVCSGLIKSTLSQASFESLTMTDIASWDSVFTGAGAWLLDGQALASRTDRTGNGGNEVSRSGSVTLQADPPGFSWGGSIYVPNKIIVSREAQRRASRW